MAKVTDQALIDKLNSAPASSLAKVDDQEILNQLSLMEKAQNPTPVEVGSIEEDGGVAGVLKGVGETVLALGSGMAAEVSAGGAGLLELAMSGGDSQSAVNVMDKVRDAVTYTPSSAAGEASVAALGNFLEPVAKALEASEKFLGDTMFEWTESPSLSAAAASLPTAAMTLLPFAPKAVKSIKQTNAQRTLLLSKEGRFHEGLAAVKLNEAGKVVKDKTGKQLLEAGVRPQSVSVITNATKAEKTAMSKMFDKFVKGSENDMTALSTNMASDIGSAVTKRLSFLKGRRASEGKRLDKLVSGPLGKQPVDISDALRGFGSSLNKDFGVKLRVSGGKVLPIKKEDLIGTPLEAANFKNLSTSLNDIILLFNQNTTQGVSTLKSAHSFKKVLDNLADSAKASEAGLSPAAQRNILAMRKNVNDSLRSANGQYRAINDRLSDIIQTMEPYNKYLPKGVKWSDAKASDITGGFLRNLGSDSKAMLAAGQDLKSLEKTLTNLGVNMGDDPRTLLLFKNAVENNFKVDLNAVARESGKQMGMVGTNAMDAGVSLAVGNKFGAVHDAKRLVQAGIKKKQADALIKTKIKEAELIRKALKEQ